MKKLGVLIIGPGWVAGEHIKAYCHNPHTEVRAIAAARPGASQRERAEAYCDRFRLRSCRVEPDWRAALGRLDIQIVSVCSISFHHYEQALAALKARKHLLLEKPVCFSLKELKTLARAYKSARVRMSVGHILRYYPAVRKLHTLFKAGTIGAPYYMEADYWHEVMGAWKCRKRTAGSSLLMGGCHAVDMIYHFLGFDKTPAEIKAFAVRPFRRRDFDYPPTVNALIRFKSGETAKIGTSLESAQPYRFHLQVMGARGVIQDNAIAILRNGKKRRPAAVPGAFADDGDVAHHPFGFLIDGFVRAVTHGRPAPSGFRQAFHTYKTIFAMEKSIRTGKSVFWK
jgi:predicted dehydrogenase